ncbi:MAG: preprotein translocase subunit SecY [Candidatus Pacearchaeota archaeon]
MVLEKILTFIPEVKKPSEKRLAFNIKLKWTLIVLVCFFVLANIPLFGLKENALQRFQYLAIIFGTDFGSIISLGIGPIVMASIVLQLLVGSKILNIDLTKEEGKKYFQGLQKIAIIFFIIFEACVYVLMKGLEAIPGYTAIVIFQLILGGLAIMLLDDLVQKWGFGSGVSLFIAAGVGWRLFNGLFQFISIDGGNCLIKFSGQSGEVVECGGKVLVFLQSLVNQNPQGALQALIVIIVTTIIFGIVVWAQSLKVEVPLSFDRLRGYSIRWPLAFFYTSVIPVILTAALIANLQLFGGLLQNWRGHGTFLGVFEGGKAVGGLAYWISDPNPNLIQQMITSTLNARSVSQMIIHILCYIFFSVLFAFFWVKTSGLDAASQAKNIISSGLQIPGFRKDERILESVLDRYILPLTIMGGAAIGLLASLANMLGAIVSGTAILLGVMIIYQFYQNIAQQHAMDMYPALKRFIQ